MHSYSHLIEKYRYFIAGVLIAILVFVTYSTDQFGIKESVSEFSEEISKETSFEIKDRCGLMPTSTVLSHTIPNDEACENECRARCVSEDLSYKTANLSFVEKSCNNCKCECR